MMSVGSIVSTVGCLLVLTSCASSSVLVDAPVKVTVAEGREVSRGMARDLRDATLHAIAKRVPQARPLTVAVVLDRASPGGSSNVMRESEFDAPAPQPRVLPSTSPDPTADGAPPTVPGYSTSGSLSAQQFAELHGTYTITNEQGKVLERNRLDVAKGSARLLLKQTGDFIASRVQSWSK
jgi:hypothetical protein